MEATVNVAGSFPCIIESTSGERLTGILYNDANLAVTYQKQGEAVVTKTLTSADWVESANGCYRINFTAIERDTEGLFNYWVTYTGAVIYDGAFFLTDVSTQVSAINEILASSNISVSSATSFLRSTLVGDLKVMLQDGVDPAVFTVSGVASLTTGWAGSPDFYHFKVSVVTSQGEGALSEAYNYSYSVDPSAIWKPTLRIYRVPEAKAYRIYAGKGTGSDRFQAEVQATQSAYVDAVLDSFLELGTVAPSLDSATIYAPLSAYSQAVANALRMYTQQFPREVMDEITILPDEQNYAISEYLLDWIEGFSHIRNVEYPVEENPPKYLDDTEWYLKDGYFCLSNFTPTVGGNLYVYYTTGYSEPDLTERGDYEAVVMLSAGYLCDTIATRYAHQSNKVIGADTVDYNMRSADFRRIAKDFRAQAYALLGISSMGIAPASMVAHWGAPWTSN